MCSTLSGGITDLWSQFHFSLYHFFYTIIHILNEIGHGSSKSSFVGNIENTVIGFSVFSVSSSDLNVIFVSDGLELGFVLRQEWQVDMNGSSHGGTEIGWA
jgi:hypothetical protein